MLPSSASLRRLSILAAAAVIGSAALGCSSTASPGTAADPSSPTAVEAGASEPGEVGSKGKRRSGLVEAAVVAAAPDGQVQAPAALAGDSFSPQVRLGYTSGDQWEPAIAADDSGHVYVLYAQYLGVPGCEACLSPTQVVQASADGGATWGPPRPIQEPGARGWDSQILIDPADGRTVWAAWMEKDKSDIAVARSDDFGATWTTSTADSTNAAVDKPILAVRGDDVYVAYNHTQTIWVSSSHDGGATWTSVKAQTKAKGKLGWSLAGGGTVAPNGDVHFSWSGYEQNGVAKGPVNLFVSSSTDGGRTWQDTVVDVSGSPPDCSADMCGWAYLGAQMTMTSDADGTLYGLWNAGPNDTKRAPERIWFARSTDGAQRGRSARTSPPPQRGWPTRSRRSPPARAATCASPGWTPARRAARCGTCTCAPAPMAVPRGRPSRTSRAARPATTTSSPRASSSRSATTSSSRSMAAARPMRCSAKASTTTRPGQSGTHAGTELPDRGPRRPGARPRHRSIRHPMSTGAVVLQSIDAVRPGRSVRTCTQAGLAPASGRYDAADAAARRDPVSAPVVVSDMDGTLATAETWRGVLAWIRANHPSPAARRFVTVRLPKVALAKLGLTDKEAFRARWMEDQARLLTGLPAERVIEMAEWVVDHHLWPARRQAAIDALLAALADARTTDPAARLVLATGAYQPIGEAFARRLGADAALGTPLEIRDGIATGAVLAPTQSGAQKAAAVRVHAGDADVVAAFGDTSADIPLLAMARRAVAVAPDAVLRREALTRGWEILETT